MVGNRFFFLLIALNWGAKREITTANFFVGNYRGVVAFEDQNQIFQCDTTRIDVIKIGLKTSFVFAAPIPAISNIVFEQHQPKNLINQNSLEMNYIRLDTNKLEILFTDGTKSWTVYADRN